MTRESISRRAFGAMATGSFAAFAAGSSKAGESAGVVLPEAFSQAGRARMAAALRGHVNAGKIPGAVALIARSGDVQVETRGVQNPEGAIAAPVPEDRVASLAFRAVHVETIGVMDLESGAPMRRDTIFRIASMTKPILAAAAMVLVEEGKIGLDEPVDKWLPELANRRVLRTLESPLDDTESAKRPITLRDLLTLRPGFGIVMVFPPEHPIQKAMEAAELTPSENPFSHSPGEYMKRLGALPLIHQPGEAWMYHSGFDILAVLLARATGKDLGDFLAERIFGPLGMKDTAFSAPEAKIDRLATCYQTDPATGKLVVWDEARGGRFANPPPFPSEVVSTADDYLAFARMMLDQGVFDATRILSRESVAAMTTDHITPEQKATSAFFPGFWDKSGWGFGLSMTTKPDDISAVPGRYGWAGGYGTTFVADPGRGLVAILLTQRLMGGPDDFAIHEEFQKLTYQAIDV